MGRGVGRGGRWGVGEVEGKREVRRGKEEGLEWGGVRYDRRDGEGGGGGMRRGKREGRGGGG